MRKRKEATQASNPDDVLPGQMPLPLPPAEEEPEEDTAPDKVAAMPNRAPAASPAVKATKWRVTNEKYVNVNGNFTRVVVGQIIDPLGYSEQSIASLRTQGVVLEPV